MEAEQVVIDIQGDNHIVNNNHNNSSTMTNTIDNNNDIVNNDNNHIVNGIDSSTMTNNNNTIDSSLETTNNVQSTPNEESTSSSIDDIINLEIIETEKLIALQQKKIALLQSLRDIGTSKGYARYAMSLSEVNSILSSQSQSQSIQEQGLRYNKVISHDQTNNNNNNKISRDAEDHHQRVASSSLNNNLDEILSPLITISTNYSVLDARLFFVRNMKRARSGPNAFEFVAIIDDIGILHIFDKEGIESAAVELGLHSPLISVSIDSSDAKAAILVASTLKGSIHVVKIMITYDLNSVRIKADLAGAFAMPPPSPIRRSRLLAQEDDDDIEQPITTTIDLPSNHSYATSLLVSFKGGTAGYMIIAGDNHGCIHQFDLNGHHFLQTQMPWTLPVTDISMSHSIIVVAVGSQFQLVSLKNLRRMKQFCYTPSPIRKISIEDGVSWSVSAALEDGSIALINTAKRLSKEETKPGKCDMKIIQRPHSSSADGDEQNVYPSNIGLTFARGYIWYAKDCSLQLLNTSRSTRNSFVVGPASSHSFEQYGCSKINAVPEFVPANLNCSDTSTEAECIVGCQGFNCARADVGPIFSTTPPFQSTSKQSKGLFILIDAIIPKTPVPMSSPFITMSVPVTNHDVAIPGTKSIVFIYDSKLKFDPQVSSIEMFANYGKVFITIVIACALMWWRKSGDSSRKGKGRSGRHGSTESPADRYESVHSNLRGNSGRFSPQSDGRRQDSQPNIGDIQKELSGLRAKLGEMRSRGRDVDSD